MILKLIWEEVSDSLLEREGGLMEICLGELHVVFRCCTIQGCVSKICWIDSKISYQRKNVENLKVKSNVELEALQNQQWLQH